jgi:methylenetetrahydrofolate reductase (NADPH)
MRFIRDIYEERARAGRPVISFEFFPPRTDEGQRYLIEETIPALSDLEPDFCSVTYGAGGSTRDKTLEIVHRIQDEHELTAMAHLTCVGATRPEIEHTLESAQGLGIRNILALRGDPPAGAEKFTSPEGGFEYSYQLVELIKQFGGFSIGTAGFPEGHIDCRDGKHADWRNLKAKIERGADFVLTQLFFDNRDFLEFRDHMVRELRVDVPIAAGVLPILNTRQIQRFVALCGAKIPSALASRLDTLGDDDEGVTQLGIDYATWQCEDLLREGVSGLHFYTLNKTRSVASIVRGLGLARAQNRCV